MRCVAPTEKDTASTTPTLQKSTSILILLGLSIGLAFFLVSTRKHIVTEQQVLMAMQSTNQVGVVTAEGTNSLLRVGSRAIPVLLQWSKGRDPVWFKWVDPVRKIFKKPPLRRTFWSRK